MLRTRMDYLYILRVDDLLEEGGLNGFISLLTYAKK